MFSGPRSLSQVESGALWILKGIGTRTQVLLDGVVQTIFTLDGSRAANWLLNEVWKDFLRRFIEAVHPLVLLLAVIGLWRGGKDRGWDYFKITWAVFPVYIGGLFFVNLIMPEVSMSHRYFLGPGAILIPWSAFGMREVGSWLGRAFARDEQLQIVGSKVMIGLSSVFLLILGGTALSFHRADKIGMKIVGERIRQLKLDKPNILSTDPRFAFYAGGRHVDFGDKAAALHGWNNLFDVVRDWEKLIRTWRESGADLAVLNVHSLSGDPGAFIAYAESKKIGLLDVVRMSEDDRQQAFFIFRLKTNSPFTP
jgi:hypothetical protein